MFDALSEVPQEVEVRKGASRKEVDIWRHELSQCLVEGSHYRNLYTTSRSVTSETLSEIQQLGHDREHLIVRSRNLETEKRARQSAVRSLEAQVAQIPKLRGMMDVGRKHRILFKQRDVGPWSRNSAALSNIGWPARPGPLSSLKTRNGSP